MPRSRTTDTTNNLDKLTDNFTSGQLVIGIVVTLFLMLGSFVVGYMARGVDGSTVEELQEDGERLAQVQEPPKQDTTPDPELPKPANTTPRPQTQAPQRNTTTPPAPANEKPAGTSDGPRPVVVAPLQPPAKETVEADKPAPKPATPPAPTETASAAETPAATAPTPSTQTVETPRTPPTQPVVEPLTFEDMPEPPAAQEEKPPPPTVPAESNTAPAPRGKFAIQVNAFFGADSAKRGEQRKQELKQDQGLDVEVMAVPGKDMHRVVLPGFATRAAADTACATLRKKSEFSDAWVIPLGS